MATVFCLHTNFFRPFVLTLQAHKRTHDVNRPKRVRRSRLKVEDAQNVEDSSVIVEDIYIENAENLTEGELTESDGIIYILPDGQQEI